MQKTTLSRISKATTQLTMACGLLMASSPLWAEDEPKCTNRMLRGDYAFHVEGVILALPGLTIPPGGIPIRGVAMSSFDGRGNMTQVDHIVAGGAPPPIPWTAGTATYTVNPNCTGNWVLTIPGSPFSPVLTSFVVSKKGDEIRTVVESNAVTSVGTKID